MNLYARIGNVKLIKKLFLFFYSEQLINYWITYLKLKVKPDLS